MLIDVLKKRGVKQAEIRLICEIYNKQRAFMRNDSERVNEIKIKRGVRQGCILSPILFNIYAEEAYRSCKIKNGIEINEKKKIYKISYADDTVIMAESEKELNDTLNKIKSNLQKWSIEINPKKTKCMVVTDNEIEKIDILIGDDKLEQVSNFQYLGIWINETMKHDVDVRANIAKSRQAFWEHNELLGNNIRLKTKLGLPKTQVWSILRYGSECFALTKSLQKKITALEFWCYRRILKISWNDYVSNEEVLLKIEIEKPELLQSVIKRKITYLGHILRESARNDLEKMTMIVNEKKGR